MMAKFIELSMQCCCFCSQERFSSPPSCRAAFAYNLPLYPRIGVKIPRERQMKRDAENKSLEWPQPSFRCLSGEAGSRKPSDGATRRIMTGSFQFTDGVNYGAFSVNRRNVVRFASDAAPQPEDKQFAQEAQDVVASVLLKAGLSEQDAMAIVSKAPVFIEELVRCIEELEESGIWAAEGDENASDDIDRRAQIYQLASRSRGISPFLESLGVHLPSVSRVSSSFSSQRLPELLSKVRYIEELLTETECREIGPRDGRSMDQLIRSMVKNLSVSVWDDEDMQRTLSFFEKMESQEGGLSALKETSYALPRIIEYFPLIFERNLEKGLKRTIRFLEDLGVPKDNLGKIILCFPPILLQGPGKDLLPRKKALKKVGVRVQDMGHMVVKYPWLLSKCVGNNVEEIAKFLESIKVPKSKIDKSITLCSHLLGSSSAAMQPVIDHIGKFGLKSRRLGRAISQSPQLLIRSPQELDVAIAFLESIGVGENDISKLMRRSPEIFVSNIESNLEKKVQFLEELGIYQEKLGRIIVFFPEILSSNIESRLKPRIEYLSKMGFSKHEISWMIFRFPPLLSYNVEAVLSPKLEFLTKTMGKSIREVVAYPRYFSYSLEKKIKPRARVLANRQIQCDLRTMLAKNDDDFAAEFLGFGSMLLPPIK